ncbi:hypothetical protein [Anatilimnocola floriformis]|uniref:hypothetical protein n=1 Tax=Anatilimnocola floriformis TaxID=2948575 RepID=UPI0020C4C60D|nr:hypothetical protein [Anatilimnocola floriformis]
MNDHLTTEPIQLFIQQGHVELLPIAVSAAADRYLAQQFPLQTKATTSVVDWGQVPSAVLQWSEASDDETVAWSRGTLAGRCAWGLLLLGTTQPCLLGQMEFMIRHLDELVWRSPGICLLFGVERGAGDEIVLTSGLIEYNGKDYLRGTC